MALPFPHAPPVEDFLSPRYTMNDRWEKLCTRNVEQMGGFQWKVVDGVWANFDDNSQTELLNRWNPIGPIQAFNLDVHGWPYTMILDPLRILNLTLTDTSGEAIGIQIAAHDHSPDHTMRWVRYLEESPDLPMNEVDDAP